MTEWVHINAHATKMTLKDIDRRANRATMWALREVGRRYKREARSRARVYTGPERPDVVPGMLKASISSSKRFKREGAAYVLGVGPRGRAVNLYAKKIEAIEPYSKPAYDQAVADAAELHARAWGKAMRR